MRRLVSRALGLSLALALLCLDPRHVSSLGESDQAGEAASLFAVHVPCAAAQSPPRSKARRSMRCVRYGQTQRDTGMELRLKSSCQADVACSIDWSLSCHGENGTTSQKAGEAFTLPKGESYRVTASAEACGDDGWSIHDVRWSCRSVDP